MNPRYSAHAAERIFSHKARAHRMRMISDAYTDEALRSGLLGPREPSWVESAVTRLLVAPEVSVSAWAVAEGHHGHEIVGFLDAYLMRLPTEIHPFVHYGLTSSDLVENELHQAIAEHAEALEHPLGLLLDRLDDLAGIGWGIPRAGRTHGQTAEATTLGHQIQVFHSTLERVWLDIESVSTPYSKSPGPVGDSDRRVVLPWPVFSTQIIPRDILLRWANAYLNLSNFLESLAMFVRLGSRSEIGEFMEGAAILRQGSSAMPGKSNPIQSEKVCGLARVARGLHMSLAQVSGLWEDRDLSNSSTERIAVPDLAATVEHMLTTMAAVMTELRFDGDRMAANAINPRCGMNAAQMEVQRDQLVGPIEASRRVKERITQ